jgi:hypothetical protein
MMKLNKWFLNLFLIILIFILIFFLPQKTPISFSFIKGYSAAGEKNFVFNFFFLLLFLNILDFIFYFLIPEKKEIFFLVSNYLNFIFLIYSIFLFLAKFV